LKQSLKFRKSTIPLIVLVIFALCATSSPVNAFEIPQFCNVISPGNQITVAYVYLGFPYYEISLYNPDNPIIEFPDPLTNDDLGFLQIFFKEYDLLPPESVGKVIILDMDFADGREIRYKIQPDFSDIEEFLIPTTTSSTVPSDDDLDLYYPVIVSETPALGGISLLSQSRSLPQSASIVGGSQKTLMNFGKIQSQAANSYPNANRFLGTVIGTIIDQQTAENNAIAYLKDHLSPYNSDDYELSSVQLVDNGNRGREYRFEWSLKPNEKQTQGTLTVSVDAKTGSVTKVGQNTIGKFDPSEPTNSTIPCPFDSLQGKTIRGFPILPSSYKIRK
jgi:hypothetical protein